MLRFEGEGVGEGVLPVGMGLAGYGEHEIDIDGGDGGLAEQVYGTGCLGGRVVAPEGFENMGLKGLDAEGYSSDAEIFEELCLGEAEGFRVCLHGDFGGGIDEEILVEAVE